MALAIFFMPSGTPLKPSFAACSTSAKLIGKAYRRGIEKEKSKEQTQDTHACLLPSASSLWTVAKIHREQGIVNMNDPSNVDIRQSRPRSVYDFAMQPRSCHPREHHSPEERQ
jgi:hypothetical protein